MRVERTRWIGAPDAGSVYTSETSALATGWSSSAPSTRPTSIARPVATPPRGQIRSRTRANGGVENAISWIAPAATGNRGEVITRKSVSSTGCSTASWTSPGATLSTRKNPSRSVVARRGVPITATVAPASGPPRSESSTTPMTEANPGAGGARRSARCATSGAAATASTSTAHATGALPRIRRRTAPRSRYGFRSSAGRSARFARSSTRSLMYCVIRV